MVELFSSGMIEKYLERRLPEEYEALITLFGLDYKQVKHKNIGESCLQIWALLKFSIL